MPINISGSFPLGQKPVIWNISTDENRTAHTPTLVVMQFDMFIQDRIKAFISLRDILAKNEITWLQPSATMTEPWRIDLSKMRKAIHPDTGEILSETWLSGVVTIVPIYNPPAPSAKGGSSGFCQIQFVIEPAHLPVREHARLVFSTMSETFTEVSRIAEGGNGIVYRVADEDGHIFACKTLKSNRAKNHTDRKRFENEYIFCQSAGHTNIITVYGNGIVTLHREPCPFFIMEFLPQSLRSVLNAGLAPESALEIYFQICAGVQFAHSRGHYHRDLKPENILLNLDPLTVKVSDWGTAHFAESDLLTSVETKNEAKLANFVYAAPEQRVRGRDVDRRADIYALGLMLNEMFTHEVLQGTGYKPIGAVHPQYAYLDPVVERMAKANPAERYPSVQDVLWDIQARIALHSKETQLRALREQVINASGEEDPILADPIQITSVEYKLGTIFFHLNREVSNLWRAVYSDAQTHRFVPVGYQPTKYEFRPNNCAIIKLKDPSPEAAILAQDTFRKYLHTMQEVYPLAAREDQKQHEAEIRADRKRKIEEAELDRRIQESLLRPPSS